MVGLSEEDIERIQSFANTPRYQRNPSGLMPDGEREEGPEIERASTEARRTDSPRTDEPRESR